MQSDNRTTLLVKAILANATAYSWSIQGLGMLRLYLSDEVRLHVWDSKYRIPGVSPMHDHPWHFESYVVAGQINQFRYVPYDAARHRSYEVFNCATIKCGENARTTSNTAQVRLVRHAEVFGEGETYHQRKDEIHESLPQDGTVTLVKRLFSPDRDHARVLWRGNGGFVSAEPRTATNEEVLDITQYALKTRF